MITVAIYCGTIVVFVILGFTLPNRIWKRRAWGAAIALSLPIGLLVLVLGGFAIFLFVDAPPTLDQIQKDFPAHRNDFQTILDMSTQDSRFDRIDPTFLDQMAPDGTFQGRYMAGDPKAELPKERWDEYRALFKRNHINLGIARDRDRDAFIMFDSQGLLDRGYATGVVFCADVPISSDPNVYRYEPCTSNETSGSGVETENPHKEAFSFRRLMSRWYAYSQGPG